MPIQHNPRCCGSNCPCCTARIIGVSVSISGAADTDCEDKCLDFNGGFFVPFFEGVNPCGGIVYFPLNCDETAEWGYVSADILCGVIFEDPELILRVTAGVSGTTDTADHMKRLTLELPIPVDCSGLVGNVLKIASHSTVFCDLGNLDINAAVIFA